MRKNQPYSLSALQEFSQPLIKFCDGASLAGGSTTTELDLQVRKLDSFSPRRKAWSKEILNEKALTRALLVVRENLYFGMN
jgi:hypothetical protein